MKKEYFLNFPAIDEQDIKAVRVALQQGNLSRGKKIEEFETAFAEFTGAKYAVALSSGSVALFLALKLMKKKHGERWIISPNSPHTALNAILEAGCSPFFADIHPETFNIEISQITSILERSYKKVDIGGMILFHFAGVPIQMENVNRIASKYKEVSVIEDGSESLGAFWEDSKGDCHTVGDCLYSDLTLFDFAANSPITTGEGGMITTNNEAIYKKLKIMRNNGIDEELPVSASAPWFRDILSSGFNFWMTDMQAAIGLSQLAKLPAWIQKRRDLVNIYNKHAYSIEGLYPQREPNYAFSSAQRYVIRINYRYFNISRHELIEKLLDQGIHATVHFVPSYKYSFFSQNNDVKIGQYAMTEQYYEESISLPLHAGLKSKNVKFIAEKLIDILVRKNIY